MKKIRIDTETTSPIFYQIDFFFIKGSQNQLPCGVCIHHKKIPVLNLQELALLDFGIR